ncbi:unnamed protein product [Prorocentrum cordatum]|uniref:Uncharacterized protein n=1 Tax=Prorocentrum cordatum TaxID=2364126 RepID=A0ABN9XFW5_9DINO|nr:unnamed protein product [Polarella glacialis]
MRRSSGTGSVAWPPAEPAAATRPRNGALPRRPVTFPRAVQIIEKGRRQLPSRGGSSARVPREDPGRCPRRVAVRACRVAQRACPRLAPLTRAQPDSAGRELRRTPTRATARGVGSSSQGMAACERVRLQNPVGGPSAAPVRARTEQEKRRTGERCRNEGLVDRVASAAREQT